MSILDFFRPPAPKVDATIILGKADPLLRQIEAAEEARRRTMAQIVSHLVDEHDIDKDFQKMFKHRLNRS